MRRRRLGEPDVTPGAGLGRCELPDALQDCFGDPQSIQPAQYHLQTGMTVL
jgi:hypothetical protein